MISIKIEPSASIIRSATQLARIQAALNHVWKMWILAWAGRLGVLSGRRCFSCHFPSVFLCCVILTVCSHSYYCILLRSIFLIFIIFFAVFHTILGTTQEILKVLENTKPTILDIEQFTSYEMEMTKNLTWHEYSDMFDKLINFVN